MCDDTDFNKFYFPEPIGAPQDPPSESCKEAGKEAVFRELLPELQKKCKKAIFQINVFFRDFFGIICQKKLVDRVYILNKNFSSYSISLFNRFSILQIVK